MGSRFYVDERILSDRVRLEGDEARHLTKAMRASVGDRVILFDGHGGEYDAQIRELGRSAVDLVVLAHRPVERELSFSLTVGVALPKGDRQRWLVEKCVEMGVTRLVPLVTARGVAQPVTRALDRLRRAVVEASKQCRRNRLMQVVAAEELGDFLRGVPATARAGWLADPVGDVLPATEVNVGALDAVWLAIGPEGGFAEEELEWARAAEWGLAALGPRILRTETAAVALATRFALGR